MVALMMVCVLYTGQYTDCGSYRTSEASDFSILVSILVVDHIGTSEASDYFFYTGRWCWLGWRRFISSIVEKTTTSNYGIQSMMLRKYQNVLAYGDHNRIQEVDIVLLKNAERSQKK